MTMIQTGRVDDGRTYTRQLLSDYLPDLGLQRYIAYDRIKEITKLAATAKDNETRDKHATEYFRVLKDSFIEVKAVLHQLELEAQSKERHIKFLAVEDLREDDTLIIEAYCHLHRIERYRSLNVEGFAKVLEKFLRRVAVSSLDLQDKVRKADDIIASSILSVPIYASANAKEVLAATYSVVKATTLEKAFEVLDRSLEMNPLFTRRILPLSAAHHFRVRSKHQQLQGTFAAKIVAGSSNPKLAKLICSVMRSGAKVNASVGRFQNGEVSIKLEEAVRSDDVYVVQSMADAHSEGDIESRNNSGTSAAIVELLLALQTATLASSARLTAVIPYMAYSKRTGEIAAIAEMLETMGCQRVITVDLFAEQVEGMFSIPVDNVSARDEFLHYLLNRHRATGKPLTNIVMVSPNADNVARARGFADRLMKVGRLDPKTEFVGVASAVRRIGSDAIDVAGNVAGCDCIIVDNVLDEAITTSLVAKKLREMGASTVRIFAPHGLFSGGGIDRVKEDGVFDEVVITDSISRENLVRDPVLATKLRILPVAPLLAGVIDCVHSDINAVSELLERM
jgi:ribose-phosphate pyrophosphokinase